MTQSAYLVILSVVVIASLISVKGLGNEVLRAMGHLMPAKHLLVEWESSFLLSFWIESLRDLGNRLGNEDIGTGGNKVLWD